MPSMLPTMARYRCGRLFWAHHNSHCVCACVDTDLPVGQLFRDIGIGISVSVLISVVVSVTVIPMLAARLFAGCQTAIQNCERFPWLIGQLPISPVRYRAMLNLRSVIGVADLWWLGQF